jgi:hypothetical protein
LHVQNFYWVASMVPVPLCRVPASATDGTGEATVARIFCLFALGDDPWWFRGEHASVPAAFVRRRLRGSGKRDLGDEVTGVSR